MKFLTAILLLAGAAASAQPPQQAPTGILADRMMAFDKNHDGKLTRDEITDQRLLPLFDRADANHDGIVTREELNALYAKETSDSQQARDFGGGPGGGPGGGRGGPGRGPGQPGQVLSRGMMDRLNLTAGQRAQIEQLQKLVDAQLGKILTPEQNEQMKQGPGPGGPPRDR